MKPWTVSVILAGVVAGGIIAWWFTGDATPGTPQPGSPPLVRKVPGIVEPRPAEARPSASPLRSVARHEYDALRNQILQGDLRAAILLLDGLESSAVRDDLAAQLVKAFAEKQGAEVLDWLTTLKPAALRGKCVVEFVRIQTPRDFALATRGVETLRFGTWRMGAVAALCSHGFDNGILAWLDNRAEPADIACAVSSLTEALAHENPSAVARLRESMKSDGMRSAVARAVGAACVAHPEEIAAMEALPGADRTEAVVAYVKRLGNVKPVEAAGYAVQMPDELFQRLLPDTIANFPSAGEALKFVVGIQNAAKRQEALKTALKRWCRDDPDAALQELQSLGITPSVEVGKELTGMRKVPGNR